MAYLTLPPSTSRPRAARRLKGQKTPQMYIWDPVLRLLNWALMAGYLLAAVAFPPASPAHATAGAALAIGLLLRLIWGMIGPKSARLSTLWPSVADITQQCADILRGEKRFDLGLSPIGAALTFLLLTLLVGLAGTGAALGIAPTRQLAQAHAVIALLAHLTISAKLAAAVWATFHYRVNLIRALITGVKPMPGPLYWRDDTDIG